MSKSCRYLYEINKSSNKFLDKSIQIESFESHEEAPKIIEMRSISDLDDETIKYVTNYKNLNYTSIAVLCKSMKERKSVYERLKDKIDIKIFNEKSGSIKGYYN